jgi:hypothetical protein
MYFVLEIHWPKQRKLLSFSLFANKTFANCLTAFHQNGEVGRHALAKALLANFRPLEPVGSRPGPDQHEIFRFGPGQHNIFRTEPGLGQQKILRPRFGPGQHKMFRPESGPDPTGFGSDSTGSTGRARRVGPARVWVRVRV